MAQETAKKSKTHQLSSSKAVSPSMIGDVAYLPTPESKFTAFTINSSVYWIRPASFELSCYSYRNCMLYLCIGCLRHGPAQYARQG